jgi:hypothetical protein
MVVPAKVVTQQQTVVYVALSNLHSVVVTDRFRSDPAPEEVLDHFPELSIEECLSALHTDFQCYTDESWFPESGDETELTEQMFKSLRYKLSGYCIRG